MGCNSFEFAIISGGQPGQRGSAIFNGSGAPGVIVGAIDGDYYIDNNNGNYYQRQAGVFVFIGTFSGSSVFVTGSEATPFAVNPVVSLPIAVGKASQLIIMQGSGGPVDITANPQIVAGTVVGQLLRLYCVSNVNTVKLDDGTGLTMNGSYTMKNGSMIEFIWSGSVWLEESRNDI